MTEQDYKFYLNQGIDKTNQGNFEEALIDLEKAIEINPNNALIYFSKAIAYHNLDKRMVDAYYNKAQTILAFEDPTEEELKEALDNLNSATDLDNKFLDAHYYSAIVKKKLGMYKSAIESLDRVLAIEPKAPYSRALKKLIEQKYL